MDDAHAAREATAQSGGIEVKIELGLDGVPVVFIDTSEDLDTGAGPKIRVRLNDEVVYGAWVERDLDPNDVDDDGDYEWRYGPSDM